MFDHWPAELEPPGAPLSTADDPIVAEVRAAREAIAAEVGYDMHRLYERLKRIEDVERAAGREIVAPPPRPTSRTDAA